MDNKDEYIYSLLLSLFLIQGEVDRLNQTLDLARKRELVYINNPQIDKLKAENERLKEENYQLQKDCQICENFIDFIPCKPIRDMDYDLQNVINQRDKYIQTLQEIKAITEELSCKHPEECFENKPDWNGEVYGCDVADNWEKPSELATCPSKLASAILQIITKAEEE